MNSTLSHVFLKVCFWIDVANVLFNILTSTATCDIAYGFLLLSDT